MSTFDLISYKAESGTEVSLSKEIVKKYLCDDKQITDEEFFLFASMCRELKLNPFTREAYIVKYGNKANIFAGKDFFIKRAATNPDFDGIEDGVIGIAPNGDIKYLDGTFVPSGYQLAGGWAKVYRKSQKYPKFVTLNLREYAKTDKDDKTKFISNWATMPAVMINKCAKVAALREAFPKDFSGLYTEEEFNGNYEKQQVIDNDNVIDASTAVVKEPADELQVKKIAEMLKDNHDMEGKILAYYGVGSLKDLTVSQASEAIKSLVRKEQ